MLVRFDHVTLDDLEHRTFTYTQICRAPDCAIFAADASLLVTFSPTSYRIANLRQQIHDDLRMQHPEWILPNGECPMCDDYEARLMDLLANFVSSSPHDAPDRMAAHR